MNTFNLQLFVNVYITNERYLNNAYKELDDHVRAYSKIDVFKYCIKSYSYLPLSEAHLYLNFSEEFIGYKNEIYDYIRSTFKCKVNIYDFRIDNLALWSNAISKLKNDELVLFTCNDDHIYIASDVNYLNKHLEEVYNIYKINKYISSYISHWQEYINLKSIEKLMVSLFPFDEFKVQKVKYDINELKKLKYTYSLNTRSTIGIQIISKQLLSLFFKCDSNFIKRDFRRSDEINPYSKFFNNIEWISFFPKFELFRHFDAYSHNFIPHKYLPPLFITDENIKLHYGESRSKGRILLNIKANIFNRDERLEMRSINMSDTYFYKKFPLVWGNMIEKIHYNNKFDHEYENYLLTRRVYEILAFPKFGISKYSAMRIVMEQENIKLSFIRFIKIYYLINKEFPHRPFRNYIYLVKRYILLIRYRFFCTRIGYRIKILIKANFKC